MIFMCPIISCRVGIQVEEVRFRVQGLLRSQWENLKLCGLIYIYIYMCVCVY